MVSRQERRLAVMLRPMRQNEDIARQAFARARGRAQEYMDEIARLEAELREQHAWARRRLSNYDVPAKMQAYRYAVGMIQLKLRRIRRLADQAQLDLEQRRVEFAEALARKKAFAGMLDKSARMRKERVGCSEARELDRMHAASRAWQRHNNNQDSLDMWMSGT